MHPSDVPRLFEVVAIFNTLSQFNTQSCLFHSLTCGKLGLRGGYFCLEMVSSNHHHHRPVWAHP